MPLGLVGSAPSIVAAVNSVNIPMLFASASTSTDGVDRLTYNVTTSGTYRLTSSVVVNESSDAGTSHTGVARVNYNNGTVQSNTILQPRGVTVGLPDLRLAAGSTHYQTHVIYAVAGTQIQIHINHAVTGTPTVGRYSVMLMVEHLI